MLKTKKKEGESTFMFKTKMKEGASIMFPLTYKAKLLFCQLYTKKSEEITSLAQLCELTGLRRYKVRRGFNELRAAGLCDRRIYNDDKGYRRAVYFIPEEKQNCTKEIFENCTKDLEESAKRSSKTAADKKRNCTKEKTQKKSTLLPLCNFRAHKNCTKDLDSKMAADKKQNCTKAQSCIKTTQNLCAVLEKKPALSSINNNINNINNIYINNTADAVKAADKPQQKKIKRSPKRKYDFRNENLDKIMNYYGIVYPEAKKAFRDYLEVRDSVKAINTEPTVKWIAKSLKRLASSVKEQIIVLEYAITRQSENLYVPPVSYYNPTWHFGKNTSKEPDFEQNRYDYDALEKALMAN